MTSEREASPRRRPDIGLADLLRALSGLDSRAPGVAETIGKCLGFGDVQRLSSGSGRTGYEERHAPAREPRSSRTPPPDRSHGAPPLPPVRPEMPSTSLQSRLDLLPEVVPPATAPPDLPAAPPQASAGAAPPFQPLFERRTAPALLGAAIATQAPGREPDVAAIITRLSRLEWLATLPTLPRPSLERGVDVLLDNGEGMRWLMDDLCALSRQVRAVAGGGRCRVFSFKGDPPAARRRRGRSKPVVWKPIPGRTVLIATRFSSEPPTGQRDAVPWRRWTRFARDCRRAGVPLVALIPQRPADWPDGMAGLIVPIHWDHRTRAGTVRNAVGRGHRVNA